MRNTFRFRSEIFLALKHDITGLPDLIMLPAALLCPFNWIMAVQWICGVSVETMRTQREAAALSLVTSFLSHTHMEKPQVEACNFQPGGVYV